ncbi:MAG: PQQ-dependent sugar dehydrogenase [Verrucomicrobiae bacterium]|nr:PQQ-dependent sugar dehydrogenase [Verrucomicrobiae bacterium]
MRLIGKFALMSVFASALMAGPLARVPNTTLRLPAFPNRVGLVSTNAFPFLTFDKPVGLASPPGEANRLFVVEQKGRIQVITNLAEPTKTLFLDLSTKVQYSINGEEGLLGLAFHPGFSTNGRFFVFYTTLTNAGDFDTRHDRLSRFQVSSSNPDVADAGSESVLIEQRDEASNHNGGGLQFGPDGYLYVSVGDEGGLADAFGNAQRIDGDFFGGILRLDVDERPGSLAPNWHPGLRGHYRIPPDNPFVGANSFNGLAVNPAEVRTEFFAVGLRNPWRFTVDPVTGWILAGDTGDSTRDEIDRVVAGGNYGWPFREGVVMRPGSGSPPVGFLPIDPIHDHPWGTSGNLVGKAIVGGFFYRGAQLPEIQGSYVFGDYITGNVWALDYDGTDASNLRHLFSDVGLTSFGVDPGSGDLLFTDQTENRIKRVIRGGNVLGSDLPARLSETGAFQDLISLAPQPGIVPYDLNIAFWSDDAHKTRWFSIPDTNAGIRFDALGNWDFPPGMVWVKTFELALTNGLSTSRRRIETRFLVRNTAGVYGVTYRWNAGQTEAFLLGEEALDEEFEIHDGGVTRTQVWHYPSRSECLQCHTPAGGLGLGFHTAQMNRDFDYDGDVTNQIAAFARAGYFVNAVSNLHVLPALARADDESVSLDYRVRSYLAANCAQCHQPGGLGLATFDARITNPFSAAGILDAPLARPTTNSAERVVVAGSLETSALHQRIARSGIGRMPPLASSVLDTNAIALIADWITNALPARLTFSAWQLVHFGSPLSSDSEPAADPDGDGAPNFLEFLTGTDPRQAGDGFRVNQHSAADLARLSFQQLAHVGYQVEWTAKVGAAAIWHPLDVSDNAPVIVSTNQMRTITDPAPVSPRFYRVRVFEP